MRRRYGIGVVTAVLVGVLIGGAIQPVMGQTNVITTAIKLFGIGYVVKTYGKAKNKDMTKVVPILSVGVGIISSNPGSYIGAAQVQGPVAAVNRVQAVAQIEGSFLGAVRLKGLVPVDNLNPLAGDLHRVYGVGVTALVDFQL